ncbi:hypothetical protein WJX84_011900, partial [Apatococcus fuscideae]
MMPLQHSKVVHFIRHGEGFHNIGFPSEDSQLTEAGWQQAAALKRHLVKHADRLRIQVVVASPLFRTLETACGVFGGSEWAGPEQGIPLMHAQTAAPQLRTAHAAIAAAPGPRIIAFEGCRERLGPDVCDRRRDTHLAQEHFPAIDFRLIQYQQDTLYDTKRVESEHSVQHRGTLLLQWLLARPESSIAVVTHHGFLGWSLSSFGHECAPAVGDQMHRGFANCEMRSMVVTDAAGTGAATNRPSARICCSPVLPPESQPTLPHKAQATSAPLKTSSAAEPNAPVPPQRVFQTGLGRPPPLPSISE